MPYQVPGIVCDYFRVTIPYQVSCIGWLVTSMVLYCEVHGQSAEPREVIAVDVVTN